MRYNKFTKIISVILSICFIFGALTSTAFAESTSSLKAKREKIQQEIDANEEKISKLEKEQDKQEELVAALDKKVKLKQDKIDNLQKDADALQAEINSIQADIEKTEAKIDKTQAEIDAKQAEFDKSYDEYCQRLRAMYISGSASNLEVLLTSDDISSILTRSQMIKSVSEQDNAVLNKLMEQMSEIEKQKAELEKSRNKLNKEKKKLRKDKAELDSHIAEINAEKAELDKQVSELNAKIRSLKSKQREYQETIDEDKEAMQKIQRQIDAAYASASRGSGSIGGSTGSGSHSGRLGYPTDYRTISAGYPNYSSGRYHGGVDFPCPTGSSVYAAASGTVILVKALYYSYGHYIIIDHGNGLSTLYAHNSQLLVSVGSHVSKGQVIARSGSTGNSTGPHCHFEVRVNGSRVNPMNYL